MWSTYQCLKNNKLRTSPFRSNPEHSLQWFGALAFEKHIQQLVIEKYILGALQPSNKIKRNDYS